MDCFLGRKRDKAGQPMLGDGKKKRANMYAKLKAFIRKHKRPGMMTADLIKFLVTRPDRKRKRKGATKAKQQPQIVQPGSFGHTLTQKHGQKPEGHGGPLDDMLGIVHITLKEAKAAGPDANIVAIRKDSEAKDCFQIVPFDEKHQYIPGKDRLFLMPAGTKEMFDITDRTEKFVRGQQKEIESEKKEKKELVVKTKSEVEQAKKEAERVKSELDAKHRADAETKRKVERLNQQSKIFEKINAKLGGQKELKKLAVAHAKSLNEKWQDHTVGESADTFIYYLLKRKEPKTVAAYQDAIKELNIDQKEFEGRCKSGWIDRALKQRSALEDLHGGQKVTAITRDPFGMHKVHWETQDGGMRYEKPPTVTAVPDYDEFGNKKPRMHFVVQRGGEKTIQPLTTSEIDAKMSHVPCFRGPIARDGDMKVPSAEPHGPISWVMNLDPRVSRARTGSRSSSRTAAWSTTTVLPTRRTKTSSTRS
jgi:hypothetical protein